MVREMREVTDPGMLDKLNGIVASNTGLKEVTDPNVLAQLNSQSPPTTTTQLAQSASAPGILDQITDAIKNTDFYKNQAQRGADLNNAVNATSTAPTQTGQQTPGEKAAQFLLHNVVGGAMQVPVAGAKGVADMAGDMTPQPIKDAVSSAAQSVAQSPVGQAVGNLANDYNQNQATYDAQNPRAARNFQATKELANILPLGGAEVRGAAEGALDTAGAALKNVTKDAINGTLESLKKDPIPTFETTKALSQADFAKARSLNATYSPEIRQQYIDTIKNSLPGDEKVLPGNTTIENIYKQAITNKDKPLTLEGIQQIDQELTDLKYDAVHSNGLPTAEGKKIGDIQRALRDAVGSATEDQVTGGKEAWQALQDANANWSASRKIYEIDKIFSRAEMTDNPATAIKAGMRNLYLNDKKLSGWTPREKSLVKAAGKSSAAANLLRTQVGSRLISSMIGTAAGSIGGIPGMMAGATIGAATGGTARAVATAMQKGRANKVLKEIGKNIRK